MTFTKIRPHFVNMKTVEVMSLRKDGGMFNLDMWMWVPTSRSKTNNSSDFAHQRESSQWRLRKSTSDPADKQVAGRGCKDIMSLDEEIPTLNVDGEALEEEMECGRNGTGCRKSGDLLRPRTAQQERT